MLASFNRYTFQPHHFVLAHDIVLDNVEQNAEQNDDNNFDCNKENDTQFTWDFPVNSSNIFHASNTSLESLNLKNAVKSKFGSRKVPLQEQIKKHKAETMEMMCSLRIEDFAKIGTDCVRLSLDSIVNRKNLKKNSNSRPLGCKPQLSQEEVETTNSQSVSIEKVHANSYRTAQEAPRRVCRRLPELPKTWMHDSAYQLSQDPVPASSLIRTPSLAEELKAAFLAEYPAYMDADDDSAFQKSFPEGFHLNFLPPAGEVSDVGSGLSELGSPEQIDPVNKYNDFINEYIGSERKACRKSCCLSDTISSDHLPEKHLVDVGMAAASATDRRGVVGPWHSNAECQIDATDGDLTQKVCTRGMDCQEDTSKDQSCPNLRVESNLYSTSSTYADSSGEVCWAKKNRSEEEKTLFGNDCNLMISMHGLEVGRKSSVPSGPGASGSVDFDVDEIDATHRGCHKFIPRHPGELAIEIGDYIYVQVEDDDLWCEGINLRTKQRGIFPTAYAMDLSLFDDENRGSKYFVKYLGSIEVGFHKGNDVLCQAINKLVAARRRAVESNPPPLCCLEITEHGVKMTDRSKQRKLKSVSLSSQLKAKLTSLKEKATSENDHLFLLKNISFCGYHPKNERYLGFITKHPLEMRFACHVFQSEGSTKVIAEAIGDAFRKFYQEYLAFVYPTEDIYLE